MTPSTLKHSPSDFRFLRIVSISTANVVYSPTRPSSWAIFGGVVCTGVFTIEAVVAVAVAGDLALLAAVGAGDLVDDVGGEFLEIDSPGIGLEDARGGDGLAIFVTKPVRILAVPSPARRGVSPIAVMPAASAVFSELPPE